MFDRPLNTNLTSAQEKLNYVETSRPLLYIKDIRYTLSNISGYGTQYVSITNDVNSLGGLDEVYAMIPFQGNQASCVPYLYSATSASGQWLYVYNSSQYAVSSCFVIVRYFYV